jgi:hypothetical protein
MASMPHPCLSGREQFSFRLAGCPACRDPHSTRPPRPQLPPSWGRLFFDGVHPGKHVAVVTGRSSRRLSSRKCCASSFTVDDRVGVRLKLNADAVSHGNAIFHIEEKLLHGGQSSIVCAASHALFLKSPRRDMAICRCRMRSGPGGTEREKRSIMRHKSTSSAMV